MQYLRIQLLLLVSALGALAQRPIQYSIRRRELGLPSKRQRKMKDSGSASIGTSRLLDHEGIPEYREYYCGKKNNQGKKNGQGKKNSNAKKGEAKKASKKGSKKYNCELNVLETTDATLMYSTTTNGEEDEDSPSNEEKDITEPTSTHFTSTYEEDDDEDSPSNEEKDVVGDADASPTDMNVFATSTAYETSAAVSTFSTTWDESEPEDEDEDSPSNEGKDVSAPWDDEDEDSPSNEGVNRSGGAGRPIVIGVPDFNDVYDDYDYEDEDEHEEITNEDFNPPTNEDFGN